MKKTVMLKKKYEFKMLFSKGKIYYGSNLTMYLFKNKLKVNKLGIAIGKKSGKAVDRNRIKRLIKENYRIVEDRIRCGYHILFSVNKKCQIEKVDFYLIQNEMKRLIQKSEIWLKDDEKSCN